MGSFNVGCGVSNLSIGYKERTGFILLTKGTPEKRGSGGFGSMFVYCNELFEPYLPPIFGEYDDYGYLADIEDTPAKQYIEKRYGISAENLVKIVNCSRGLFDTSGEIYGNFATDEIRKSLEALDKKTYNPTAQDYLKAYGFAEEDNKFTYEGWSLQFETDHKVHITNPEGKTGTVTFVYNEHLLKAFAKVSGILPGYPKDKWGIITELNNLYGMYFLPEVVTAVVKALEEDFFFKRGSERFNEDWVEFQESLQKRLAGEWPFLDMNSVQQSIARSSGFPQEDLTTLTFFDTEEGRDNFRMISELTGVMTAVNRMFQPSFSGEQHGNHDADVALNTAVKVILDRRSEDYE